MRALRSLAKSPGFSLTVIATLALGIGANTAIFSVVNAVLLAPLPYPDAARLVSVQSRNQQQHLDGQAFAPAGFREFERQVTSFEKVAAYRYNYTNLTRIEKPVLLTDAIVTQSFFDVLGVKAFLGRTFLPEDAAPGARRTVVLSYQIWQNQFGARPDIVGQTITLDDAPYSVIGVMPRSFKEPRGIAGLWRVIPNTDGENFSADSRFWNVLGRLKSGVPPATVKAELATIAARLAQADAKFYGGWDFTLQPLQDLIVGNYRKGLLLVIGAALLVLLVMCANVAGLQLVRASVRQRDNAIRLALGASRWTVAREQLTESLLLVVFGGIAGVLLAQWGLDLLLAHFADGWIPRSDEIAINTPVLLITSGAALLIGFTFGLFPAWRAARVDAADSLRGGKGSAGAHSTRFRAALVIGQIALTLVLLVGAGLVLKSFAAIMRVNPGMQVENTLSLGLSPAWTRYNTDQKRRDYYRQIVERVKTIPGVDSAAFTETMPFTWGIPANFSVEGRADGAEKLPSALYDSVSPAFFSTVRIALIAGRTFTEADDAKSRPVIVLSQTAARKFFPNENPIGRHLLLSPAASAAAPLEVIGIVGDVPRDGLDADVPCQAYASMDQRPWYFATLLVRSSLPVESLTRSIERQIWSLDPDQPIANVALVRKLMDAQLTQPQLYLTLFSLFAALALLLAALGLYGLIAYSVAQRTRELGIRVALGAQTEDMFRLVLGQGARLTAAGLLLGLAGAVAFARLMQALLFHTTAYDPYVFCAVTLVLAVVALLAALLPARRATKVDPIIALRTE